MWLMIAMKRCPSVPRYRIQASTVEETFQRRSQLNRFAWLFLIVAGFGLGACSERSNVATSPKTTGPSVAPTTAPSVAPTPAVPSYRASLEEGIAFAKPGYPEFVARAEGISQTEPFGRWTDGPKAVIVFKDPLPKKFELVVTGAAYGPNVGQPVKVNIGGVTQEIMFNADMNKDAETQRLSINLEQPADRIEFLVPRPTQPANGDVRRLGIALVELKIETPAK